ELLCTAGMVVYHPDDKRYQHLNGKKAIVPIYDLEIPIQPHPIAKQEYGSGIMYMSKSAGDQNAIRFLIEMKIEPESCITTEGKMDKNSGFLDGMKVDEARKAIIERLEKDGFLVKKEEINHSTPICERSKHAIEFITMPEFYVKQLDFLGEIKKVSDKISFYSKKNKQLLLDWISSVSIDWPVSRRRIYATEIPLWYCKKCKEAVVPEKGKYYQPWKDQCPVKECSKCKGKDFEGETRVFDTWFDSSISPLYILQYTQNPEFFKKAFPATLRPQGKEIVRTWLYYTLLRCYQLTGKPVFDDVWIHYHILDKQGRKMSKSLGNVVDPAMLIDKFGAEPVRLWAALEGNLVDTDFMCAEDKIQGNGKFLTKLWNVARFISGTGTNIPSKQPKLCALDQWILSEISQITAEAKKQFGEYDFHNPTVRLRHFIWEIFASHYLELVKSRAYNLEGKFTKDEQESAVWTLNYVLDIALRLLSPVIPFITYKIYKDLRGKDVHMEKFPEIEKVEFTGFKTEELMALNSAIWKVKRDKNISLKDGLDSFEISKKFKPLEKEIIGLHKIKEIKWV
ncbi:MAG TPA: class I tRNA ligase family protein, partial [archaeon]|nr:class I tRNA ligase family protein [archaeon]